MKNNGTLQCELEHVDQDSILDMVCHFDDVVEQWTGEEPEGTLTGTLGDGTPIAGQDQICLTP